MHSKKPCPLDKTNHNVIRLGGANVIKPYVVVEDLIKTSIVVHMYINCV